MPWLVEIDHVVLENKFIKIHQSNFTRLLLHVYPRGGHGSWLKLTWFLLPMDDLYTIRLKWIQWSQEEDFQMSSIFFFTFWLRVICPLGKRHVTLLEQTWIPLRQECFVCQVVLVKKMKNFKLKFTTMTSTTTTTYDRKLTQDASDWILSQCKGPRLNTRIPLWSWAGSCPTSSLSIYLAIYFRLGLFRWIPSPKQTLSLKKWM